MKKILFLFLLLAAGLRSSIAAPVSSSVAAEFAENFLDSRSLELVFTGFEPDTKSGNASFYAFNRPSGGWVIISADNCATPVLAHSDSGKLSPDNLPLNMKAYLKTVTDNISRVSGAGIAASEEIRTLWAAKGMALRTKAGDSSVLLNTASWGQEDPYNQTVCSQVKSGSTPVAGLYTGCVATSMAITLRYLCYPAAPSGTSPSYKTDTRKYSVSEVDLGAYGDYNWENMPMENSKNWTADQKKAVADLMYHCGVIVKMDYTSDVGSGAFSSDIPAAMAKYMGFGPSAEEYYRENYSNYEWFDMLKSEIDAGVPVMYGGGDIEGEGGGHQFVVDGYNSNREVHVNWGWEGSLNGWYAVCYIGNVRGVEGVFNYYDTAILGLRPSSASGTACPHIFMTSVDDDYGLLLAGNIFRGETFRLSACVYNENTEYAYKGKVIAALVDADGNIKEQISPEYDLTVSVSKNFRCGEGKVDCQCKISGEINLGDFVSIYYKNGYGKWERIGGANHDVEESSSGKYYTVSRIGAVTAVAYIYSPSILKSGDIFYCDLVTDGSCPASIVWSFDNTTLSNPFIRLTSGKHIVQAAVKYVDGSTQTIRRNITVE